MPWLLCDLCGQVHDKAADALAAAETFGDSAGMSEPSPATLLDRTLDRIGRAFRGVAGTARLAWSGAYRPDLPDEDATRLARQIVQCLDGRGGEPSARARAAQLGQVYLALDKVGRARFLGILARNHGIDRPRLSSAVESWQAATDPAAQRKAEATLRAALTPASVRLLAQFNALPEGVKFLVDLRADLLPLAQKDRELGVLADDLRNLLVSWFDIGFLDLERITWDSPAALLERLVAYESVHEIRSWRDLKTRLASDRRCFAFFHPRMPYEPLIFVEVALVNGMVGSVQALLDESRPALDASDADTAIFYSISNCQQGLAGVSFGDFLIKRVVDLLATEFPQLGNFATLSPIPGFRAWLEENIKSAKTDLLSETELAPIKALVPGETGPAALRAAWSRTNWWKDADLAAALQAPLMRLCAQYLLQEKRGTRALDRVANFHLSNGARIERLNWLGDTSRNGLRQSAGLMVNYRYKLDEIEANHEAYTGQGRIAAHAQVKRLLKA